MSLRISAAVGEKAVALVEAGRVTLHDMQSATVIGRTGVYEVRAHKGGGFTCTCPARGARCSHIAAASLAWAQEIERAGLPLQRAQAPHPVGTNE